MSYSEQRSNLGEAIVRPLLSFTDRLSANIRKGMSRLAAFVVGLALTGLIFAFLTPLKIVSNSMSPAVRAGDVGIALKTSTLRVGDVVVFRYPFNSTSLAVKRIVALGGQCFPEGEVSLGALEYDGHRPLNAPPQPPCDVVPDESVFLLGDNRRVSIDSRTFGPVATSQVIGRLVAVLPTGALIQF